MKPPIPRDLWKWIEENRGAFEPPVGNKVIWKNSQFTAMIIRGPNARRDFHVDLSSRGRKDRSEFARLSVPSTTAG